MKAIQLYTETPEAAVEREPALVANPNCQQCGLCDEASSVCMRAAGEPGGVLLVGDYPGAVEDKRGVPFTGKTGRFLQRYAATIWAGPIAVDNAVRCYPKRGAGAVGKEEIEACRGYLAHTVRLVKPQRIVAMGGKAIQGVLGRSVPLMSVRRGYGWLYNININDSDDPIPVFELFNPVNALRNKFMRKMFEADLRWALTCEIPQPPPWEEDCYVIENRVDSEIACNILRSAEWFAYDCEAVGIQYKKDYVVISLAACARGSSTVYVWDRTALYTPDIFEPLGALLRDPNVGKTGQNLKYDSHAVDCAFGVELQNYKGDARLQRRLLAADVDASLDVLAELVGLGGIKEEAQKALKKAQTGLTVARKRFREDPEGERLVIDNPILLNACINADEKPKTYTYGLIDNTVMLRYNARDALTTARACELTEGRLEKEPVVKRVWTEIVSKANYSIKTVERWGIPTRELNVKRYQSHLDRKMQVIKTRFDKYEGLNLNSPKSVGNLLYKQLGLHPPKTTDTGESSTDHETLEALRGQHKVVDDLLEWRRLGKLFGFAKGIERHICPDGRIHPSFKIDGTRTGRISCTEPNLQNISRPKDEDAKFARDLFVAEAGWELLEADYCLVPGTRIFRSDLTWVPIEQIEEGDELIAFDEAIGIGTNRSNKLRGSIVERVVRRKEEAYEIVTEKGKIVASADHLWVATKEYTSSHSSRRWVKTKDLRLGDRLSYFCDPWDQRCDHEGGWMAGFLDGEGWVSSTTGIGFGQNSGLVLERALDICRKDGFEIHTSPNKFGCVRCRPVGAWAGLRMVGTYRPIRLLSNARKLWDGRQSWGKKSERIKILDIRPVGRREVISIRTSSKTLIAEGFLTHNSQLELRVATMLCQDPKMLEIWQSGVDYHQRTAELISKVAWGIAPSEVTKEHRNKAKVPNFGVIYGMTASGLAKKLGCSVREAEKIITAIRGEFTVFDKWCKNQIELARRTGFVWTWWDGERARRRPLLDIVSEDSGRRINAENGAVNTSVQGTASDFCLASITQLVPWILKSGFPVELVLTVHDSIMFHVRADAVGDVVKHVRVAMTQWNSANVPLVVDFKRGISWGSLEEFKL